MWNGLPVQTHLGRNLGFLRLVLELVAFPPRQQQAPRLELLVRLESKTKRVKVQTQRMGRNRRLEEMIVVQLSQENIQGYGADFKGNTYIENPKESKKNNKTDRTN